MHGRDPEQRAYDRASHDSELRIAEADRPARSNFSLRTGLSPLTKLVSRIPPPPRVPRIDGLSTIAPRAPKAPAPSEPPGARSAAPERAPSTSSTGGSLAPRLPPRRERLHTWVAILAALGVGALATWASTGSTPDEPARNAPGIELGGAAR